MSDPLLSPASTTSVPSESPEMILFLMGKDLRVGAKRMGNSEMTAPRSEILLARARFSCGCTLIRPPPRTATVSPSGVSRIALCATVSIPHASPETTTHPAYPAASARCRAIDAP